MSQRQPPVDYIERTREQYSALGFPPYSWVENPEPVALSVPSKPAAEWRVSLVASGGIYAKGQIAFHFKDDLSYREIATDTENSELRTTHFAYDLADSRKDPGAVFPLAALRNLVAQGAIGSLADNAYTFMGGIYSSRKVRDVLAPAIADRLVADEVDVAVMVPV